MTDRDKVSEIDILAYADGLLDGDPAHRAAVENALSSDAAARARAGAFRAQTDALRAAYAGRLAEPVPERLRAALDGRSRSPYPAALRAVAMVALLLVAGAAGWMLAQDGDASRAGDDGLQNMAEQIRARFTAGHPPDRAEVTEAAAHPGAFERLSDELSIRLKVPDLTAEGYTLTDTEAVTVGDERLVRLDYAGTDAEAFSLFLAPRWKPGSGGITQTGHDRISMAYWGDGPLALTIVARMPAGDMRRLAETVRRAVLANAGRPSAVEPAAPSAHDGVIADSLTDTRIGSQKGTLAAPVGVVRPN